MKRHNAFKFGERAGSRNGSTPALFIIARNCSVNTVARSWIKNLLPHRNPSDASVRFRATCFIQFSPGSGTMPAI
jgi:hypothetical protein